MRIETEKAFFQIITNGVRVPDSDGNLVAVNPENILIEGENFDFPQTNDLFIIIQVADVKVTSNTVRSRPTTAGMEEVSFLNQRENVQIDLISRDRKARRARPSVLMAIGGLFSQQLQETHGFKIAKVPTSFVKVEDAEGGNQQNRYSIVIPTQVWYEEVNAIPADGFYDTFNTRVDDENTIGQTDGLIEFTITE